MSSPARFRRRDHTAVNALWLGVQFQDAALMAIIVPALLLQLAPARHTSVLAVLSTLAACATAIVPPIAGALSDRDRRRGGDRRLHTLLVLVVDAIALVIMSRLTAIPALAVAVVVASIALTTAQTIYQVFVPEIVPQGAWGVASGVRGAMTLIGTIVGLVLAAVLPPRAAVLGAAGGIVFAALTLVVVPPSPPEPPAASGRVRPPDRRDLIVTLIARAWIVLGMTLLNTYVLYFFSDVLGVHNASLGTGAVAGAALVGAVISSVAAGLLSDRVDRRRVVALAGLPMAAAALGFAIAPSVDRLFVYAGLFGLGYGAVFSVGWALALDAVPELGDVGRDLGLWATLSNVPMIPAPALGAAIIAHGATPAEGYRGLFAAASGCFLIGSLTVLAVRAPRPR